MPNGAACCGCLCSATFKKQIRKCLTPDQVEHCSGQNVCEVHAGVLISFSVQNKAEKPNLLWLPVLYWLQEAGHEMLDTRSS